MNYPITDEQSMILDSLQAFLKKEIYPFEAEADRAGKVSVMVACKSKSPVLMTVMV